MHKMFRGRRSRSKATARGRKKSAVESAKTKLSPRQAFASALSAEMRKYNDSHLSLLDAVKIAEEPHARLIFKKWASARSVPRWRESFELLGRVEARYGLRKGYFKSLLKPELPSLNAMNNVTPNQRHLVRWHLPTDFDKRSEAQQRQIVEWIEQNVLAGATEFGRYLSRTNEKRFRLRFSQLADVTIRAKRIDRFSQNAGLLGSPVGENEETPPQLVLELDDLVRFKRSTIALPGFHRHKAWSKYTAELRTGSYGRIFGAMMAAPRSPVAGLGVPKSHKGIKTKKREHAAGKLAGGVWFGKGALTYLLKNPTYIGQISHRGEIHSADHEPIVERGLFEAVQAKLRSNVHLRKLKLKSSPYLLTGLLFDSAGNRMSPSHTLKKGVRYQYYVSQGVLQGREVGEVARVSSQDLEVIITTFLHQNCSIKGGEVREALRRTIQRITVRASSIDIELAPTGGTSGVSDGVSQVVSVPWRQKVSRAEKGIAYAPTQSADNDAKAREALLAAIGRARVWLKKLTDGETISDIAKRDGRSERQIRILLNLAFLPPSQVKVILDGSVPVDTITNVARSVPVEWPELAA